MKEFINKFYLDFTDKELLNYDAKLILYRENNNVYKLGSFLYNGGDYAPKYFNRVYEELKKHNIDIERVFFDTEENFYFNVEHDKKFNYYL